ncbi:putative transcription factor MYB-HB-like family [Helianthus debilis subsp. tardiflorus]
MEGMMGWKEMEKVWRKGPWTPMEDKLLMEYVALHGEGRWSSVAGCSGLKRNAKSCRLRWVNYLRPGLKKSQLSPQEEGIIIELHALWGNSDCVCGHKSIRSDWSWVSDDDDTNIGIRAKGLTGSGRDCDQGENRIGGNKGKSVMTDYGDDVFVRSGECVRAAEADEYAQEKPTMRTRVSQMRKFPKKVFRGGFTKKNGKKPNAPVGRPRKPGVRCFKCKKFGHIASICPSKYIILSPLPVECDYIVKDTCGGKWDSIWVVDPTFKTHMTGNRNLFKCFKRHFGVVTNESKKDVSFVHGIG